jgi:hypothetical protein
MDKQLMRIVLVILFCAVWNLSAVTCTTTGTGDINWSNPASWTGCASGSGGVAGTPGAGDDIAHPASANLVVDVPSTIGTGTGTAISMTGGASCRMTVNAALTVNGDWVHNQAFATKQVNPTVDVAAGVAITFNASGGTRKWQLQSANSQYTWIRTNGTSGARVTITSTGGDWYLTRGGFTIGSWINFQYTDLSNIFDGTRYAFFAYLGNTSGSMFVMDHCTVTNSGEWGWATNNVGNTISITNSYINASRGTWSLLVTGDGTAPTGTAVRVFTGNVVLGKQAQFNAPWGFALGTVEAPNYFEVTPSMVSSAVAFPVSQVNFYRVPASISNQTAQGDVTDSIILFDGSPGWSGSPTFSPHGFNASAAYDQTFTRNLFMSAGVDGAGDFILTPASAASALRTHQYTYNLSIPDMLDSTRHPGVITHFGYALTEVYLEHNTLHGGDGNGETGGIAIAETNGGFAGALRSAKSNLIFTGTQSYGLIMRDSGTNAPPVAAAGFCKAVDGSSDPAVGWNASSVVPATYNRTGAVGRGYDVAADAFQLSDGSAFDPATNTTDVIGDPQFVDPTRNLITWYRTAKGQASTGTDAGDVAAALSYLVDHWHDGGSTHVMTDLKSWVSAGYAPTNPAYIGTAHDGGDRGAVDAVISATRTMALPMIW